MTFVPYFLSRRILVYRRIVGLKEMRKVFGDSPNFNKPPNAEHNNNGLGSRDSILDQTDRSTFQLIVSSVSLMKMLPTSKSIR